MAKYVEDHSYSILTRQTLVKCKCVSHLVMSSSLWPSWNSSTHGILLARILEWVAISFSRGSSQPRYWTRVSHVAGRIFTIWATREAWQTLELIPILHPYKQRNLEVGNTDSQITPKYTFDKIKYQRFYRKLLTTLESWLYKWTNKLY